MHSFGHQSLKATVVTSISFEPTTPQPILPFQTPFFGKSAKSELKTW
jgi:hypothetical protein